MNTRLSGPVGAAFAALAASVLLAGCGSGSPSPVAGDASHSITASECESLQTVIADFESTFMQGVVSLDYVNDAEVVDRLGGTVAFPGAVSDSYQQWRDAIDQIASALADAGVKPNETPSPEQMDELNSKLSGSDSLTTAGATINTWVSNGCD